MRRNRYRRDGCRILAAIALVLALAPAPSRAAGNAPLPDELSFVPSLLKLYNPAAHDSWNEMPFPNSGGTLHSGKHWSMVGRMSGVADSAAAWKALKAALVARGWSLEAETPRGTQIYATAHFSQKGVEAWANVDISDADHVRLELVEAGPLPYTFTLAAPQATPERIDAAKGDFPYLIGLPGSKLGGGNAETDPFTVTLAGASQPEIVAKGSIRKWYRRPDDLSNALFMVQYRGALTKAGWTIVRETNSADAAILAHFSQQGRNIWADLHLNNDKYDIRVADAGAGAHDLGRTLSAECHVALYGVLFDFNKATLQPASDPVLQGVLPLFKTNAALKIEVQGHTDNVGTDAYNQTLSEARAAAVVTWLTQHGVTASQLSAKGYGKTTPVADNNTDAGRAKNRRVEIAEPRCVPKKK